MIITTLLIKGWIEGRERRGKAAQIEVQGLSWGRVQRSCDARATLRVEG